jgi:hypothetical protein
MSEHYARRAGRIAYLAAELAAALPRPAHPAVLALWRAQAAAADAARALRAEPLQPPTRRSIAADARARRAQRVAAARQ